MKLVLSGFLAVALLLGSACGRNQTLDTQADARDDVKEELLGKWTNACEGSRSREISVEKDKITFSVTTHAEAECKTKLRTVSQSGSYKLAHNYKTGILNSIVFVPSNDVEVTLHQDTDATTQTNVLIAIRANEKEAPIPESSSQVAKKQVLRANEALRQTLLLSNWVENVPKVLNRLQLEKLSSLGVAGVAEQNSHVSIRYELDNGFLQIGANQSDAYRPGGTTALRFDLNGVYVK